MKNYNYAVDLTERAVKDSFNKIRSGRGRDLKNIFFKDLKLLCRKCGANIKFNKFNKKKYFCKSCYEMIRNGY